MTLNRKLSSSSAAASRSNLKFRWPAVRELRGSSGTRKQGVPAERPAQSGVERLVLGERVAPLCADFLMPETSLRKTVLQAGCRRRADAGPAVAHEEALRRLRPVLRAAAGSRAEESRHKTRAFLFKDELEAYQAENGPAAEPGGNRPVCTMNSRLGDLLLVAEQKAGKDQKPVNAARRVLRQSGVRLDT